MKKIHLIYLAIFGLLSCNNDTYKRQLINNKESRIDSISVQDTIHNSSKNLDQDKVDEFLDPKFLDASDPLTTTYNFFKLIEKKRYKEAYELQKNPIWNDYEKFKSVKNGYGGVREVVFYNKQIRNQTATNAEVILEYYAEDFTNGSKIFNQEILLQKYGSNWKIVKAKLVGKIPEFNKVVLSNYEELETFDERYSQPDPVENLDKNLGGDGVLNRSNNEYWVCVLYFDQSYRKYIPAEVIQEGQFIGGNYYQKIEIPAREERVTEQKIYCSNVVQPSKNNYDENFKLLDKLEHEFNLYYVPMHRANNEIKITNRKVFKYKTYSSASKKIQELKRNR